MASHMKKGDRSEVTQRDITPNIRTKNPVFAYECGDKPVSIVPGMHPVGNR
jgi:hypothetical protein